MTPKPPFHIGSYILEPNVSRHLYVVPVPEPARLPFYPAPTADEIEEIKAAAQNQVAEHCLGMFQEIPLWRTDTATVIDVDVGRELITFTIELHNT